MVAGTVWRTLFSSSILGSAGKGREATVACGAYNRIVLFLPRLSFGNNCCRTDARRDQQPAVPANACGVERLRRLLLLSQLTFLGLT